MRLHIMLEPLLTVQWTDDVDSNSFDYFEFAHFTNTTNALCTFYLNRNEVMDNYLNTTLFNLQLICTKEWDVNHIKINTIYGNIHL